MAEPAEGTRKESILVEDAGVLAEGILGSAAYGAKKIVRVIKQRNLLQLDSHLGKSTLEVARTLRAQNPNFRIVITSASHDVQMEAVAAGFEFIAKDSQMMPVIGIGTD